jgi:hypothetical protein
MPSRLLREGILDSDAVNKLSWQAEVFYRRLMSAVDDFGRFDARLPVLRGRLYSLKLSDVREADISRWLAECEAAGLIALYAVDGKPYLLFHRLGQPRSKDSKFPAPPQHTDVNGCAQMKTDENICAQMKTDVPYSYSDTDSDTGSVNTCPQPPTGGKFKRPTIEQVREFCTERNNSVDPQAFIDFYDSKGWLIGKNPMKDWKAAVRTWERNSTTRKPSQGFFPSKAEAQDDYFARMAEDAFGG